MQTYAQDTTFSTRNVTFFFFKNKVTSVLLIHEGGDTGISWSRVGCSGKFLDNLLSEGKIKPMIVVLPNGKIETRSDSYIGQVSIFTDDLMTGIIPFVGFNYNIYSDRAHSAIMGLSFGGLETLETVTYHYDDFDYIGVLSSGRWINDTWAEKRGLTDDKELRVSHLNKIAADFKLICKDDLLYPGWS